MNFLLLLLYAGCIFLAIIVNRRYFSWYGIFVFLAIDFIVTFSFMEWTYYRHPFGFSVIWGALGTIGALRCVPVDERLQREKRERERQARLHRQDTVRHEIQQLSEMRQWTDASALLLHLENEGSQSQAFSMLSQQYTEHRRKLEHRASTLNSEAESLGISEHISL